MGGCASCNAAAMTAMEGTAKVVLPDGGLLEYDRSVTAGSVLGKDSACFFVCDADEMEMGGFVSAVSVSEELCSGQLYFVLPRSMLNYPLRAEDLAALAVKASTALIGAAGLCGRRAVAPLFFPVDNADRRRVEKEKQDWHQRAKILAGAGRHSRVDPSQWWCYMNYVPCRRWIRLVDLDHSNVMDIHIHQPLDRRQAKVIQILLTSHAPNFCEIQQKSLKQM